MENDALASSGSKALPAAESVRPGEDAQRFSAAVAVVFWLIVFVVNVIPEITALCTGTVEPNWKSGCLAALSGSLCWRHLKLLLVGREDHHEATKPTEAKS
jgi:hypothetical protein